MNNRRLALLVSLCAVLFGFAVAKQPEATSAKALLTATSTPSRIPVATSGTMVPTSTATPTCPSYYPRSADTQAQAPNITQTLDPTRTTVPTPNYYPCYVHPALVLGGPSQVSVGQLFTLSIAYENIGMQHTTIRFNDSSLAQFDPPLSMPCKYDQHPNRCTAITLRATNVGVLVIEANATGESFNNGWFWSGASAKTPLTINIIDPNATPTNTPTFTPTPAFPSAPCFTPTSQPLNSNGVQTTQVPCTPTPTPTKTHTPTPTFPSYPCYTPTTRPTQKQAPQVTQAPCTPTPTSTVTPTFPSAPCFTPTPQPLNSNGVQTTRVPCTPTPTATKTTIPCPTNLALNVGDEIFDTCIGTPTITPNTGIPSITPNRPSPTITPIVKELILSAPPLVNVGDAFSLTIQYVNIGVPYTGITLSPTGTVQFDPPLTMPCKFNEHPTDCRTIGLRAVAPGMIEIDAGATGEVPIAGGGWAWGSAQARNPINVQVRSVLEYKAFIPYAKVQ